jgi:hypothetical protein
MGSRGGARPGPTGDTRGAPDLPLAGARSGEAAQEVGDAGGGREWGRWARVDVVGLLVGFWWVVGG